MNGKHESGCNCDDCLEYLGSNDLDQWMPNDEDISGILRTTLSTDDVRSRVTHRTLLETERGNVNGDRKQESSTNGDSLPSTSQAYDNNDCRHPVVWSMAC
jgi:hypothetical protein